MLFNCGAGSEQICLNDNLVFLFKSFNSKRLNFRSVLVPAIYARNTSLSLVFGKDDDTSVINKYFLQNSIIKNERKALFFVGQQ